MTITSGTRLGPYEVVSRIGAGGMGEVFRARDTRLNRNVAIKVLSAEMTNNEHLKQRLDREARTISQLSHPNICMLHDVGDEDGVSYLVMELLEGESLADRLAKGPLPLTDVLRIGAEIAEALSSAHGQGVVHRDVKPGNVMLTRSGAKLLDFGLAKPRAGWTPTASLGPQEATQQKPLTAEGTTVGTFQYMAPEQLEGQESDERTDIFALGCVLYEMATGKRAFDGATWTSLIAAIVSSEPRPIRDLQPLTPPSLEHVIEQCLSKDPDQRWQSAQDVAKELRWISSSKAGSAAATPRPHTGMRVLAVLPWLLTAATLALVAFFATRTAQDERLPIVASLIPPANTRYACLGDFGGAMVISPDGRHVVFLAVGSGGSMLWLRSLDATTARPLAGTEQSRFPFWSPDSRSVGFFTASKLKRVEIAGGVPVTLAPAIDPRGGAWAPDGTIVFTPDTRAGLMRVSSEGGAVTRLTTVDNRHQSTHRWPSITPDGKHVLFFAGNHSDPLSDQAAIFVASLDGQRPVRKVVNALSQGVINRGKLLYARGQTIVARDIGRDLTVSGEPVIVADGVLWDPGIWRGAFSVADNGAFVYHPVGASLTSHLMWLDRSGKTEGILGPPGYYFDIALSPDGKRVVASEGDPKATLYTMDVARGVKTRFSFDDEGANSPIWSADGSHILFSQGVRRENQLNTLNVYSKAVGGAGAASIVCATEREQAPSAMSADGNLLLISSGTPGANDVYVTATNGPCKPSPLIATAANEYDGTL